MKVKTSSLTDTGLDYVVAKLFGLGPEHGFTELQVFSAARVGGHHRYTADWAQGGPILSDAKISRTIDHSGQWIAYFGYNYSDEKGYMQCHSSELVAGLRCFVAMRLGATVEIPKELL